MEARISVITICFNNLEELKHTMQSVDRQRYEPYEHWIIDGSTNTEIRDYLKKHPQPAYRKWISERDSGISDAFNKGVLRADGDIVNMLNSGDMYATDDVISTVTQTFHANSEISWMHSKVETVRGGVTVILGKPFDRHKLYRGMRSVWHQSMFVRKSLHTRYGLYNTNIDIAMDYDFLCRIANEPFLFLGQPMIRFAAGGISQSNYLRSLEQIRQVYTSYFGKDLRLDLWQLRLKLLNFLLKSPLGNALYRIKVLLRLENM